MAFDPEVPPLVGAQLAHAERILADAGSRSPKDEALVLLGSLLGMPIALLLAQSESRLSLHDQETYAAWTTRRAAGEAIPRITGHLAFMGLDLSVGRDDPLVAAGAQRLVGIALECARHGAASVSGASGDLLAAEVGTGCGAIALALAALEPRFACIYAVDPSTAAIRTAAANGARYLLNLVIHWLEGAGLDTVPEPVDLIVCRWPGNTDPPAFERLLQQAPAKLQPGGALVCGLESTQGPLVAELLESALPGAQIWLDPPSDGAVVVVAQTPRPSASAAAFELRR